MTMALFPDVVVNGETIPSAAIAAEAQNHGAPRDKPGIAWRKAAQALTIRALLLQEAGGRILEGELRARLNALKTAPELPPVPLAPNRIFTVEADDDPLIPPDMRVAVRERLQPGTAYRFLHGGHFPYVVRPDHYTSMLATMMTREQTGPAWGEGKERTA